MLSMWHTFRWISKALWRWDVVAVGFALTFGTGVAAMYGDDYTIAALLFFFSWCWLTARALAWEEVRGHEHRRGISILILCFGAAAFFASLLWIGHRYEHVREASGQAPLGIIGPAATWGWLLLRGTVHRVVAWSYFRPGAWFLLGAAFIATVKLMLKIGRYITGRRTSFSPSTVERGFLDYKLEAEQAMAQLPRILSALTKIMDDVGSSLQHHTRRLRGTSGSTALGVKRIRKAADSLNMYSRQLDKWGAKLDCEGNRIVEGFSGYLPWLGKQQDKSPAATLAQLLRQLIQSMNTTVAALDSYLSAADSNRGVSRDLNLAVDTHCQSIRRIRNTTIRIIQSCTDNLNILEQS